MANADTPCEPNEPSFEQSLERLEAIVHELEEGRVGLSDALARYEEGVKLLRHCYGQLEQAERRIELLSHIDAEGRATTEPFEDEAADTLDAKADARSKRRSRAKGESSPRPVRDTEVDERRDLF